MSKVVVDSRSHVFQSCLAATPSFGPISARATDRRNEDLPEPFSPGMTFQPATILSGSIHSRLSIERIFLITTLLMNIKTLSCHVHRRGTLRGSRCPETELLWPQRIGSGAGVTLAL